MGGSRELFPTKSVLSFQVGINTVISFFFFFQMISLGNLRGNKEKKGKVIAKAALHFPRRISVTPHSHGTHKKHWLHLMLAFAFWPSLRIQSPCWSSNLSSQKHTGRAGFSVSSLAQGTLWKPWKGRPVTSAQSHTQILITDLSHTSLTLCCVSP